MTFLLKAHMLRCAAFFVTAAYRGTPHSSEFARLAYGSFYKTVSFSTFC